MGFQTADPSIASSDRCLRREDEEGRGVWGRGGLSRRARRTDGEVDGVMVNVKMKARGRRGREGTNGRYSDV